MNIIKEKNRWGFRKKFHQKICKMKPKKLIKKKIDSLFDKASNRDTEAMITLLAKSGRGYEMNEADLASILQNRQEGT